MSQPIETLAAEFNAWLHPLLDLTGKGVEGKLFTEEGTEPAIKFMANKGLPSMALEEATKAIAKKIGYKRAKDFGLEHQVQAAWQAPDGRVIFYCDLQGGMFIQ